MTHTHLTTLLGLDAAKRSSSPSNTLKTFFNSGWILSILFLFLLTASANAAVFTVNTLADNESNGCATGNCTLREAVTAANNNGGADTINFLSGLTGTINLTGGQLPLTSDMTINGPGARNLTINAGGADRAILVSGSGVVVNMSGLTITGGNAVPILIGTTLIGDGGGILNTNGGTLNLSDSAVTGNHSTSLGGGIATRALLLVVTRTNINRCLISGNSSTLGGGGISNVGTVLLSSAATSVTNSTITNNVALAEGGGVSNTLGVMGLTNNTISHNTSAVAGGGITNVAVTPLGSLTVLNNILAQNKAVLNTNLISSDGFGTITSLGGNLIGNNIDISADFAASIFVGVTPQPNAKLDLVGSLAITFILDPNLGPLQNNGGPTDTRGLSIITGSWAINTGNNCVINNTCPNPNGIAPPMPLTSDQRGAGFNRLSGAGVDMGAQEVQLAPLAATTSVTGRVLVNKGSGVRASVYMTDMSGNVRTTRTDLKGFFQIDDVEVGHPYIFHVVSRNYQYSDQLVTVMDDAVNVTFTPDVSPDEKDPDARIKTKVPTKTVDDTSTVRESVDQRSVITVFTEKKEKPKQ